MSKFRNKYKICFQNRINLWGQQKMFNFRNKKWGWCSSKNKKTVFGSIFFIQHRKSLRFLFKGFLRLRALLRFSRSLIKNKQFVRLFKNFNKKSPKFNLFLNKLNTRLDFVIYNSGFLGSIFLIRQQILHGCIVVNGVVNKSPNFFLKSGDLIEIQMFKRYHAFKKLYLNTFLKKPLCSFLEINFNNLSITLLPLLKKNFIETPYEDSKNIGLLNFL